MSEQPLTRAEEVARSFRSRRTITWLIMFAIVMFFAGLTSAYVVSASGAYWVDIKMPRAFALSTVAIVLSSGAVQMALVAGRKGRKRQVLPWLLITLLLGLVFTWSQFKGWDQLVTKGNHLVGGLLDIQGEYGVDHTISKDGEQLVLENGDFYRPSDGPSARPLNAEMAEQRNTASSYFYVLTAAHLAHLAFGLLALLVMLYMAFKGRYDQQGHAGLWAGTVYWHFLGGLWIYLFLFLTIFH